MDMVRTRYGLLPTAGTVDRHQGGGVRALFLAAPAALDTALGRLVPQHTIDDSRRMTLPAVTFHENGQVRSLPLERREIVPTPAGPLPAELVTFHDNGAVARVFPLNGKLSGYWTEADESALAEVLTVPTPIGPVTAKFVAVAFDPQGRLRSLTLWPGEVATVPTPVGEIPARLGVSFYADGTLRSLEPARPVQVPTPVGLVWAYDPDAVGVSGDDNSLVFAPGGQVVRVATARTAVVARLADGSKQELAPASRESLCGDAEQETVPLVLEFSPHTFSVRPWPDRPSLTLPLAGASFSTRPHVAAFVTSFSPKRCSL